MFYVFMFYGPSDIKMLMQFFDILCLRGGNLNAFRYSTVNGEGKKLWCKMCQWGKTSTTAKKIKMWKIFFNFSPITKVFFSTLSQIAVVGGNLGCFFVMSMYFLYLYIDRFFFHKFYINECKQNKLMVRGDTCWFWLQFATSNEVVESCCSVCFF